MNFLSGIGLAAAGVKIIKKMAEKPSAIPESESGKALAEQFRFSRGHFRWKQDPTYTVIKTEEDLYNLYREQLRPVNLRKEQIGANMRVVFDRLEKMPEAEARALAARNWPNYAPVQIPGYKPPKDEPVTLWDIFGVASTGRFTRARANRRIVFNKEMGWYEFQSPQPLTEITREIARKAKMAEAYRVNAAQKMAQYRQSTGKEFDPEVCSVGEYRDLCKQIGTLLEKEVAIRTELVNLEAAAAEESKGEAIQRIVASAKGYAQQLRESGVRGRVIVRDGVIQIDRGLELDPNHPSYRKAVDRFLKEAQALAKGAKSRLLIEEMSLPPEARALVREEYFRQRDAAGAERHTLNVEAARATRSAPGSRMRITREFVPGEDLEGLSAAGMTAPNIAVVDGLGMSAQSKVIGFGSLLLLGAGAFVLYRMFQPSPTETPKA